MYGERESNRRQRNSQDGSGLIRLKHKCFDFGPRLLAVIAEANRVFATIPSRGRSLPRSHSSPYLSGLVANAKRASSLILMFANTKADHHAFGRVNLPCRHREKNSYHPVYATADAPAVRTHARALHRSFGRRGVQVAAGVPQSRAVPLLQKTATARRRPRAISLRRNRPPLPRRHRRHRHRRRGPLPPARRRRRQPPERTPPARADDLPAPEHRRVRPRPRRENARRPEGLLFRQQRLGSQRPRAAHGPRVHGQLRHHRVAQRLPRRQQLRHGADSAFDVEVQRAAFLRRAPCTRARPLPGDIWLR